MLSLTVERRKAICHVLLGKWLNEYNGDTLIFKSIPLWKTRKGNMEILQRGERSAFVSFEINTYYYLDTAKEPTFYITIEGNAKQRLLIKAFDRGSIVLNQITNLGINNQDIIWTKKY